MARASERDIYFYDIQVVKHAVHAPLPSLRNILGAIKSRFDDKVTAKDIRKGSATLVIGDINFDDQNECATMLIRLSDKMASNAAYSNPQTDEFRLIQKLAGEGGDFGCHVIVSLRNEQENVSMYCCAIEGTTGVSHSTIQTFLNHQIRSAVTEGRIIFEYPDASGAKTKDGAAKMHSYLPLIHISGRPSADFIREIESGKIERLALVHADGGTPMDGAPFLTSSRQEVIYMMDGGAQLPQMLWNTIKGALYRKRKNYEKAKIYFRKSDTKTEVIDIDTETGTPEQRVYVKSVRLSHIAPLLDASSEVIVPHLEARMKPLLLRERQV